MSTKISALDERLVANIDGEEFFPIIDFSGDPAVYHTYKIRLDTLFASGQGYEKVTSLDLTADSNNQFQLTYTKEDTTTDVITINKYAIEDNDVAFTHIDPAGYITSTETVQANLVDDQLVTPLAVDNQITYREALYDVFIKDYIGDDDSGVLIDFATLTNVADDFTALLDGVNANLNTFKKIEDKFATIDYSDKIGISQVNLNHFRINPANISTRLNIKDKAITTVLLNDSAVTPNKLAVSAVETNKIKDLAVTTNKLNDSSVTAIKIQNGIIGYDKLSPGKPEWDEIGNLRVANRINASSDITTQGRLRSFSDEFHLYSVNYAGGNFHYGRALSHIAGDKLNINRGGDYTGGVEINGAVSVPDLSVESIKASANGKLVVTKDYVDEADVLLNPIAGDKIQDNAIALNHMSDNSVGTFEILDDSITSAKIENIGPQWDSLGSTTISKNLNTLGNNITFGSTETTDTGNILLLSGAGIAKLEKLSGVGGDFTISNNGAIKLNVSGKNKVALESNVLTSKVPVVIDSDYTTIGGINISNPLLKLTGSTPELGSLNLDSNEVVQKGSHLYLGVIDPTQNIYFRQGANNLVSIDGETGDLFVSGAVRKSDEFGHLHLYGGASASTGATINLYGSESSTRANSVLYTGYNHTFRNAGPAEATAGLNTLEITQNGSIVAPRFSLVNVAANPKSLVTKEYITQEINKVFPDDHYVRIIGDTLSGDLVFDTTGEADEIGIKWTKNSDFASIQFHNTGDSDPNCRLEFQTGDNDNEYFLFTHKRSSTFNGDKYNLLKISNTVLEYKDKKVWHEGNHGPSSGLNADLLDGHHGSFYAEKSSLSSYSLTSHNHDTLYAPIVHTHVAADITDLPTVLDTKIGITQFNTADFTFDNNKLNIKAIFNHNHRGHQGFAIRDGETHGGHFVSKFTSTSTSDGGGILIDVTDNNGDEEAISVYNDYFKYPVFRVKSQTGNTKIRGELEVGDDLTLKGKYINLPNIFGSDSYNIEKSQASGNLYFNRSVSGTTTPILTFRPTGGIALTEDGTLSDELVTKHYVDNRIGGISFPPTPYLPLLGGTVTGGVTISGHSDPDLSLADSGRTVPRSAYASNATNLWLKGNSDGVSGVFFESSKNGTTVNATSDGAFIQYRAHGIGNTTGEQSDLVIGVTNDTPASNGDKIVFNTPGKDQLVITYDAGVTEHKIWHAGNDGHASGLNADTLDGNHANVFALRSSLSSYSLTSHNHDTLYAAKSHSHTIGNITNLQSSLDAKLNKSNYYNTSHFSVTNNKLNLLTIKESQIGTNAVTTNKIADDAVTPAKLSTGAPTWSSNGTLTTGAIYTNGEGVEVNYWGVGDRNAYVDFHAAGTDLLRYDHNARLIREPGVNGTFKLVNKGTGPITVDRTILQINNPKSITTKEYVDSEITKATATPPWALGGGVVRFISIYSGYGTTPTDGGMTTTQLNGAKLTVGALAQKGDVIIVQFKQKYSYHAGNWTATTTRAIYQRFYVSSVNSSNYTLSGWTAFLGASLSPDGI